MPLFQSSAGLQCFDGLTYPELTIEEGGVTFLAGKSGCGKSTYLKLLNRTILPTAGTLQYQGTDVQELPVLPYRKSVLLVPQEVFLFDATIEENFHLYSDARESARLSSQKIGQALHLCCADFALDAPCRTLSGGERQRVFLAIFLSCQPQVLLLDEPTAALDEQTAVTVLENLKDHCSRNRITVVCVCHNDRLIQQFSDHTIVLEGSP